MIRSINEHTAITKKTMAQWALLHIYIWLVRQKSLKSFQKGFKTIHFPLVLYLCSSTKCSNEQYIMHAGISSPPHHASSPKPPSFPLAVAENLYPLPTAALPCGADPKGLHLCTQPLIIAGRITAHYTYAFTSQATLGLSHPPQTKYLQRGLLL